ncbi:MAG: copper amine oxidase domain protein [Neobacillus sp.]|jgi:hypothetical protein|nr:copper amine oxidase domain protein [Neobacillus sp.]
MKMKLFSTLILGLCLFFGTTVVTFADSNEAVLAKQAEIDKYIFEDHAEELEARGISVTHTAPSDTTVEIGILPYNQENIDYFIELFGEETITLVDGQMAVTFVGEGEPLPVSAGGEETTEEKSNPLTNPLYLLTALIILAGAAFGVRKLVKK